MTYLLESVCAYKCATPKLATPMCLLFANGERAYNGFRKNVLLLTCRRLMTAKLGIDRVHLIMAFAKLHHMGNCMASLAR